MALCKPSVSLYDPHVRPILSVFNAGKSLDVSWANFTNSGMRESGKPCSAVKDRNRDSRFAFLSIVGLLMFCMGCSLWFAQ